MTPSRIVDDEDNAAMSEFFGLTSDVNPLTSDVNPLTSDVNPLVLSNELTQKVTFANFVVLCGAIALFGICCNIVNVAVFLKQGFNDTVNVSLFTLAVADMASLIFLFWIGMCFNMEYKALDLPFGPTDVMYLTGGIPRLFFTRVTGWITSVVASERCVCVLKPLHVKLIFTKRRVIVILIVAVIATLMTMLPVYYTTQLSWKMSAAKNKTYVGLVFRQGRHEIDRVSFILGIIVSFSAFGIVTSSTVILGWSLVKQSRWRARSMATESKSVPSESDSGKGEGSSDGVTNKKKEKSMISARDRQAVRTVTFIAAMFVVCFSPHITNLTLMSIFPEYNQEGKFQNIFYVTWSFAQIAEAICSSANIFVYYKTNKRFRETLQKLILQVVERKK